jgi:hypothetical protein
LFFCSNTLKKCTKKERKKEGRKVRKKEREKEVIKQVGKENNMQINGGAKLMVWLTCLNILKVEILLISV